MIDLAPEVVQVCAPPPVLTVSEWADAERILPESSAARGARWRTAFVEYMREFMDSTFAPGVSRIALMKAHQSAGSESAYNAIGYGMVHQPRPMLLVMPTAEAGQMVAKERLGDMVRSTPALRGIVHARRSPGPLARPESTLNMLLFPSGFLSIGGANTPNTFARAAVRLAIGDDVDRWPAVVGEEGDPGDLLENRTTSFHDGRTLFVSTPTVQDARIDSLYRHSDQRRYHVTCPACGRASWPTWNDTTRWRVAYDERNPATARLECPCGHRVHEPGRMPLVRAGRWQATATAPAGHRGYHVPAMLSPFVTLSGLVERWLDAQQRGREALRVFVNTSLAEPWVEEDRSIRIATSEEAMMAQREPYDVVPHAASWITAAVDVQDDRFEVLFGAWGPREELWVLHHQVLTREAGFDPYAAPSWDRLYHVLMGNQAIHFTHASGRSLPVQTIAIDSGFQTHNAYRFSRFDRGRIFATKGVSELQDGHLVKFSDDRDSPSRTARPIRLVLVNTSAAKERIADRIRDGRIHFPIADWCGGEFFAQVLSEICEPKFNTAGIRVGQRWVKQRARNEILDLLVLNLAARAVRETTNLDAFRAQVGLPPLEGAPAAGAPTPAAPPDQFGNDRGRHAFWNDLPRQGAINAGGTGRRWLERSW